MAPPSFPRRPDPVLARVTKPWNFSKFLKAIDCGFHLIARQTLAKHQNPGEYRISCKTVLQEKLTIAMSGIDGALDDVAGQGVRECTVALGASQSPAPHDRFAVQLLPHRHALTI